MEVTNVRINRYQKGSLLAFADIQFDGCMTIKGWKLFKGREGRDYDVRPPSEPDKKGETDENGKLKYWPFVWIDTKNGETGKRLIGHITDSVVREYNSGGSSQSGRGQNWPEDGDDVPF